jgi:hypothetical protein
VSIGGAAGQLISTVADSRTSGQRLLSFAELSALARQSGDATSASESLNAHFTTGVTGQIDYRRFVGTASVRLAARGLAIPLSSLDASATYGRISTGAPVFEQFLVGGLPTGLIDPSLLTQRWSMGALPVGIAGGDRLVTYRASTDLLGLAPYLWAASTATGLDRFDRWHRVVGVELTMDLTPMPVLGLPGARLLAGVGYSYDEPFAHETRGYLDVTLRP